MDMIDQHRVYADRHDAGIEVGKILETKYKDENALVLGIPRGGVVIAFEVARVLNAELSVVITKKLPHPLQEELAIGAAAEDGSIYLTSIAKGIPEEKTKQIVHAQKIEIQSRIERFRDGKSLPEMSNRIVIIADDGIATGSTIVPAIKLCKNRHAAKVIVASPVSGQRYVSEINELADEVVIADQPDLFFAVGQVYDDFHHMSDEEVIGLLKEFERHSKKVKTN
jgi:putative phosphoribosyl transferase